MKSKKNIVLIGMMGSGKSSIGKLLSKEMNLEFIDIDRKIEMIEDSTISDIFKKKGENYFREIEKTISIDNLKLKNKIISLGGGGFINNSIRKQCSKNCSTLWLNWKMETLMQRINNSKKRPLAMRLNSFEMKKLINERAKIYNLSDYKINCDKLDKQQIVKKIVKIYENK
tara:strand:- start:3320 stop:3832 length:513 start_codon:yes stop_codon:yes gene_type:complete